MVATVMEKVNEDNFGEFVDLIVALAEFEHLSPPNGDSIARLREHALGTKPFFEAYLVRTEGRAVAYLILIQTYSSFLAKPTLYIEDIFVLEDYRKQGIGKDLFAFCARKAQAMGCGRMEWQALDWNTNAIRFYERMGGHLLKEWVSFRMDERAIDELVNEKS